MQTDLFYNTNHLNHQEILVKEKKARFQNDLILDVFKKNRFTSFTPAQIHILLGQRFPLTSVRRAISQLTELKRLVKTNEMRPGLYGDNNHCWKFNLTN